MKKIEKIKIVMKKEKGVTLVALVTTIIVMLILSGITIGTLTSNKGLINQSTENSYQAQKESIIEKIEANLYSERVKTGKIPSKEKMIELAGVYGTVDTENEDITISDEGEDIITIEFSEITGWKEYNN